MKSEPGLLDTVSGFVKSTVQDFLDGQAQDMASGFIVNADESIQSSVRLDISDDEQAGAEMAQSFSSNVSGVTSAIGMIANLRNGEITPSREMIMGSFSLLVKDGAINVKELSSYIPESMRNIFLPTDRVPAGQKYKKFMIGDTKILIKWHSRDLGLSKRFPKSNSARVWTAQIKVHNKFLMSNGGWTRKQKSNRTHIPIIR